MFEMKIRPEFKWLTYDGDWLVHTERPEYDNNSEEWDSEFFEMIPEEIFSADNVFEIDYPTITFPDCSKNIWEIDR